MISFKSYINEDMSHKSVGELKKIARSWHPHSAQAMSELKRRGIKVYNPATGKTEDVNEAKREKYSMKQAIDWFAGDAKDVAWTMSSKTGKRGDPEVGFWLDMSSGEVVPAKEKNPPKGVKVYKGKNESVEEEANPTATGDVVGTGDDVADWKDPKKKKKRPLTRHYIEINGKRKRIVR